MVVVEQLIDTLHDKLSEFTEFIIKLNFGLA